MVSTSRIGNTSRPRPGRPAVRRGVWFTALLLTALTMGLEFAHVLEWPQKAAYSGPLYTRLQESLYLWFGDVGGALYVLAIVLTVTLAILLRAAPGLRGPVGVAAALQVLALITFFTIVYPVNQHFPLSGEGGVPAGWASLRLRWEAGHATGFALFGTSFVLLLAALLGERRG